MDFKYLVIGILILGSCQVPVNNPKERNKLVFANNIESVYDSVSTMNELIIRLNSDNFIYTVSDSFELRTNYQTERIHEIGRISSKGLINKHNFNFDGKVDINRFANLALYLKRNYLSRCEFRGSVILYYYRNNIYMSDSQEDLIRVVILTHNLQGILTFYKVLDNFKDLYLFAYKDAKIWESKYK